MRIGLAGVLGIVLCHCGGEPEPARDDEPATAQALACVTPYQAFATGVTFEQNGNTVRITGPKELLDGVGTKKCRSDGELAMDGVFIHWGDETVRASNATDCEPLQHTYDVPGHYAIRAALGWSGTDGPGYTWEAGAAVAVAGPRRETNIDAFEITPSRYEERDMFYVGEPVPLTYTIQPKQPALVNIAAVTDDGRVIAETTFCADETTGVRDVLLGRIPHLEQSFTGPIQARARLRLLDPTTGALLFSERNSETFLVNPIARRKDSSAGYVAMWPEPPHPSSVEVRRELTGAFAEKADARFRYRAEWADGTSEEGGPEALLPNMSPPVLILHHQFVGNRVLPSVTIATNEAAPASPALVTVASKQGYGP